MPPRKASDTAEITFKELEAWHAVAATGSFGRAAEQLPRIKTEGVKALVYRLARKVRQLHSRGEPNLFHTEAGLIKPTPLGEELANRVGRAVADIQGVTSFLRGDGPPGETTLAIAAPLAVWEHDLLSRTAPLEDERVHVRVHARGSDDALRALRSRSCHLAVAEASVLSENLPPEVRCTSYGSVSIDLLLPRRRRRPQHERLSRLIRTSRPDAKTVFSEIAAAAPLVLPGRWSSFRRRLEQQFAEAGVPLRAHLVRECDVGRAILWRVEEGLGISIQQHWADLSAQKERALDAKLEKSIERISLRSWIRDWKLIAAWWNDIDAQQLDAIARILASR